MVDIIQGVTTVRGFGGSERRPTFAFLVVLLDMVIRSDCKKFALVRSDALGANSEKSSSNLGLCTPLWMSSEVGKSKGVFLHLLLKILLAYFDEKNKTKQNKTRRVAPGFPYHRMGWPMRALRRGEPPRRALMMEWWVIS